MVRTNFYKCDLPKYQKAIIEFKKQTGSNRLFISQRAFDKRGNMLTKDCALYDKENGDLTDFWKIFDATIITEQITTDNSKVNVNLIKKVEILEATIITMAEHIKHLKDENSTRKSHFAFARYLNGNFDYHDNTEDGDTYINVISGSIKTEEQIFDNWLKTRAK